MARKCTCDLLLRTLREDPRLRLVPAAAREIWLEVCMMIESVGGSVLRFGSSVPNRIELARLLQVEVTELEPNLDRLIGAGVLLVGEDGALMSPLLAAAASRSEINRANALKAGEAHRRRREARERQAALERTQGALLMPIAGSGRTDCEPKPNSVPAPVVTTTGTSKESQSVSTVDTEFVRIGQKVIEAAGFDNARWMGGFHEVQAWLSAGATEEIILGAVRRVMARDNLPRITSLKYFSRAVMDDVTAAREEDETRPNLAWRAAVDAWARTDRKTPMPNLKDFPPHARAS